MTSNAITEIPEGFHGGNGENAEGRDEEGQIGKFHSSGSNASDSESRNRLMKELTKWFRPELLNRIDDIVMYRPLSEIGVQAIAGNELEKIRVRMEGQGTRLDFDSDIAEWIAKIGYDPVYGARPLKRAINREILDPIATFLMGKAEAVDTVRVSLVEGEVRIA